VEQAVEVLGREDLHRVIESKRRADRVRSDPVLAAKAPRHEARLGGRGHAGVSLGPQQQPLRVTEHREVTGVLSDLAEELAEQRHDSRERMGVKPLLRLVLVEHARRTPLGIDAGRHAACPRAHNHLPQYGWRPALRERHIVRAPHQAGLEDWCFLGLSRPRAVRPSSHA
jgi:hypothetical protein